MIVAKNEDLSRIVEYLKPHVSDCIYMYIDIAKYGLDSDFMKVWYSEKDSEISSVVMKYHTGIAVYTDDEDWDVKGIADIIREEEAMSVTARRDISEALQKELGDNFEGDYGYVFEFKSYYPIEMDVDVETAEPEDTLEIAKLIMTDEGIGSYYEIEDFANQLAERMETNMGRSYIVRDNGRIIAHIASYAEFDHIATTSGLIVDPEYRSSVLGSYMEKYLVERLLEEGFRVYTYVTIRLRKRLLESMGNVCVGEYGKLMKRG